MVRQQLPTEEKIRKSLQKLQQDRIAVFRINALTRRGRDELMAIFTAIFSEFGLNPAMLFNLYTAVVEIVFNAIKANAKHVIFKDEVRKKLIRQNFTDIEELLEVIFREEVLRDFMSRHILPDKLKRRVNTVLRLAEKKRTGKGDKLTRAELQQLAEFNYLLKKENAMVHLTFALGEESIIINVVNDIPILPKDMARIEQSRSTHRRLYEEGRSTDYFGPDYLDQTESAGFGIAMADEIYYEMGLDPLMYFTITASGGKTLAVLRFPRDKMAL
ncbi:MAG: hypothetical protein N2Z22_03830 [Turneriella sp.]|nr:hypothetical protein [Leptospiraceae bacterium]MCX7632446.1 hypothetical protein [Turneriella sp.]